MMNRLPRVASIAISGALLVVLFMLDLLSGYEMSFSIFYLLPILLAAWFVGRSLGIVMSVLSAVAWLTADIASGHRYSYHLIPLWNTFMRLIVFLMMAFAFSKIKKLLKMQEELALKDSLTGIPNTRFFYQQAGVEIARARRFSRPLTIAYIDFDDFKHVNDSQGHKMGDILLCSVSKDIMNCIRTIDIFARLGGDEFALIFPETDPEQAKIIMERMCKRLIETMAYNKWPASLSIGVVTFLHPPLEVDELIRMADDLMYKAKRSGKNKTLFDVYAKKEQQ